MNESTVVSIEIMNDEKWIHYLGYGYVVGDGDKPARWVDYTGLYCPLAAALEFGIYKWEAEFGELVQQYIEDLTYEELDERYANPEIAKINVSEITMDTPCGMYFIIKDREN